MTHPSLLALLLWSLLAALTPSSGAAQLYRRPVTCDDCINFYSYFDHRGQDWNCGGATYNGHRGSDFSLVRGNFSIDTGYAVVAMADGVVRHSEDGYFDRCTQCGGANCGQMVGYGFANQVHIDHGENTVVYGHMRMGSIKVTTGDRVECGQEIGQIGSSGCSTAAHLHVEPRPLGQGYLTAFDPYQGQCSPAPESLWVEQGPARTLPSTECDGSASPGCPPDTFPIWTCLEDGSARRRCVAGDDATEGCDWGCEVMAVGTDDECALPPDADGDGSRADVDCADDDPAVHPGAVDTCGDAIDQDCSGADEDCPSVDVDMDGTPEGIDCDDGDSTAYPGAPERCGDGIDQNCDGVDTPCMAPAAQGCGPPAAEPCAGAADPNGPGATQQCGDGVACDALEMAPPQPGLAGSAGASAAGSIGMAGGPYDRSVADGGCGCRLRPRQRSAGAGWLVLLAVAWLIRRSTRSLR